MHRMQQMTETLQLLELNIIDAMAIIQSTVELLKKRDYHDTMNQEINPGEFQRKRRMRKAPVRFDPNQETTAKVTLHQFYRGEFIKLLNMLI